MGFLDWISPWLKKLPACDTSTRAAYADVDIAGYNYCFSRYRSDVAKYPSRIIVGSESSPSRLVEAWPLVEEFPQIIGDYVWTAWDYLGEAGISAPLYNTGMSIIYPWPARLTYEHPLDGLAYDGQRLGVQYEYILWVSHCKSTAMPPYRYDSTSLDCVKFFVYEYFYPTGYWLGVPSSLPYWLFAATLRLPYDPALFRTSKQNTD